jgi:hypothetical protein
MHGLQIKGSARSMVVIAEIRQATNPQFLPHNNEGLTWLHRLRKPAVHNHSSELLEHLMAEEISLQVQKIAEGLQREGWPMALVKRFMHVAVEDLPE